MIDRGMATGEGIRLMEAWMHERFVGHVTVPCSLLSLLS
jgi:hypothetical protein